MTAPIGHNGPPKGRTFKRRWASALFARPDKPAGAVAMGFKLYMEMDGEGCGAVISDREFCDSCGLSERAVQNFKRWLLDQDFVRIHLKGARGRANEFQAIIPGEQITAPNAGIPDEYRHPLPAIAHPIPASHAGNPQMTAPRAGNPPASRARIDIPFGNNSLTKQTDKQLLPEQEAARSRSSEYDADFPALNGTAVDLIAFIGKHANVQPHEARRMLKSNISAFGAESMLQAYSSTLAAMAESVVAAPYRYLLAAAQGVKSRPQRSAAKSKPSRW